MSSRWWRGIEARVMTMTRLSFFHLSGDGAAIKNFIVSGEDYRAAFNLIGVCAFHAGVIVVAFCLEDTHPHILLYGTYDACMRFKLLFESSYLHHVARTRTSSAGMKLDLDLIEITDRNHLMNVGTYTIVQPTKDGRNVLPYDYRWGTGSMYFRPKLHIPIWCYGEDGIYRSPVPAAEVGARQLRAICCSRMTIPGDWLICNGLILPDNYVDVALFESIYQTANCFRTFLAAGRKQQQEVQQHFAAYRGVAYEDAEARERCGDCCQQIFGFRDVRRLNPQQRITLAQQLWRQFRLSRRQLATLVRLPYEEICKYT